MNCQQFESRLNDLLDERAPLELDESSRTHCRRCLPCRKTWTGYRDLSQAVRFRAAPQAPRDLGQRIVEAVLADETALADDSCVTRFSGVAEFASIRGAAQRPKSGELGSRQGRGRMAWLAIASAAAAVLVAAACWTWIPRRPVSPMDNVADAGSSGVEARPLSELAHDAAKCYAGLARETRSDLSDVLALVPSVENAPAVMLLGGGAAAPSPEVAAHVREGLRPLTQSTLAAFTSLFGAAPGEKPSSGPQSPEGRSLSPGQGEL